MRSAIYASIHSILGYVLNELIVWYTKHIQYMYVCYGHTAASYYYIVVYTFKQNSQTICCVLLVYMDIYATHPICIVLFYTFFAQEYNFRHSPHHPPQSFHLKVDSPCTNRVRYGPHAA